MKCKQGTSNDLKVLSLITVNMVNIKGNVTNSWNTWHGIFGDETGKKDQTWNFNSVVLPSAKVN